MKSDPDERLTTIEAILLIVACIFALVYALRYVMR